MNASTLVLWTASEVAKATGGTTTAPFTASSVSIDSRAIQKGDIFIALKGENFDGHDYVATAAANGAAAAMVHRQLPNFPEGFPLIVVKDTTCGLEDLAAFARKRSRAKVIGVTGSVGKTSMKEMLNLALSAQGKTHCSAGNLNNHYGVPLSLSRMPADANFAVMEMGMNHAGEIRQLTRMVRPHVAVISTVEAVHLEFFDSVEAIADAKSEIFEGVEPDGVAVLNHDNPHYARMQANAKKIGRIQLCSFGAAPGSDVHLAAYHLVPEGTRVKAQFECKTYEYTVGVMGEHAAKNSLAVIGVVAAVGADVMKAVQALSQFSAPEGRGKIHHLPCDGGYFTLIDDSYNASPASITMALQNLNLCRPEKGRTVAVLGDMRELGKEAVKLHLSLAPVIAEQAIDRVHTAGEHMQKLAEALPANVRGHQATTAQELLPLLLKDIEPGDVVLVKGSHGSKMYTIAEALLGQLKAAV